MTAADDLVIIHYWQKGQPSVTITCVRWSALADELASLHRGRRHAIAWFKGDEHGEQLGGVSPHPESGRLEWWCAVPEVAS